MFSIRRIAGIDGMLDAMRDMVAQNLFLHAAECRPDGRDLCDDIDTVAVFLDHTGEATHLTLDAVQAFETGSLYGLLHV